MEHFLFRDVARFDYLLKSIELMSVSNKELEQTELEKKQIEVIIILFF